MKLDHVGLNVSNLDAQAAWYSKAFDLTTATPFVVEPLNLRGLFLTNSDGFAIELLERQGASRASTAPESVPEALLSLGFSHLCFRVEEVEPVHQKLLALGAKEIMSVRPAPEPGVTMSYVSDPEGNLIEIIDRKGPVRP
jgi:catechol 2,3-dioxygenase-like lactoylglutathione lyase family enzyme